MELRLGIGKFYNLQGDRLLETGPEMRVREGGESWSTVEQPPPLPHAVVRGANHLLLLPGLEGLCQLPGKGTLPIPIPSTVARPP